MRTRSAEPFNPDVIELRASSLLQILDERKLAIGRRIDPTSGKSQLLVGRILPQGGIDMAVVVAGIEGRSICDLFGKHLIDGQPAAEQLANAIDAQFVAAQVVA